MPCVTQRLETRFYPCGQVDKDPPLTLLIEPAAIDRINAETFGEGHETRGTRDRLDGLQRRQALVSLRLRPRDFVSTLP